MPPAPPAYYFAVLCSHAHRPGPGVSHGVGHGVPRAAAGHRASGHTNDARAGQRCRNAVACRPRARAVVELQRRLPVVGSRLPVPGTLASCCPDVQHALEALPLDEPLIVLADFDGTLAEFHPNPAAPMLTDVRREWLRDIAAQPLTFAGIVSGRRVADLRRRAPLPSARVLRRSARDGDRGRRPMLAASRYRAGPRVRAGTAAASAAGGRSVRRGGPGGQVGVAGRPRARRPLRRSVPRRSAWPTRGPSPGLPPAACVGSRASFVVEYLPNVACHKGDAVAWIARDVQATTGREPWVVFLGDDLTDEDAFRAIGRGHRRARRFSADDRYASA